MIKYVLTDFSCKLCGESSLARYGSVTGVQKEKQAAGAVN